MKSNFDFLAGSWSSFQEDALEIERTAFSQSRTCAFYARRVVERVVGWMYQNDKDLRLPYKESLAALIYEPTFKNSVPRGLFNQIRLIHKLGNQAVHTETKIGPREALHLTQGVYGLLAWVVRTYSADPPDIPQFNPSLIKKAGEAQEPAASGEQLRALESQLRSKDEEGERQREAHLAELEQFREEIARIKAENEAKVPKPSFDETEAETRDAFIDVMLREAGWDPHGENVEEYEVQGMPTEKGIGYVDYVLWGDDGLPLAVVEAKRTKKDPREGQRQAELYADCLNNMTGRRPVIYYTNGYETWLWDDTFYPPRPVQGYCTKDELELMVQRRTKRGDITKAPINETIVDRYYHMEAIRRLTEAFGQDRQRAGLLVMATGTGKTRDAIALTELLMQNNWARRVLFLADRSALLTQAKRFFTQLLPNISTVDITKDKEGVSSRVVFSTYHTMLNVIDDAKADGEKRFSAGHFDLIIIDEAHRSIYHKFGAIFDYFDALLLGLTATPKADVDRNTYHIFGLEDHVPTYDYELEQAVADEYLVPPRAVSVPIKFLREGVKYADLSEEEKEEYEKTFLDEETGTLPLEIDAAALNQWLFNTDTVDKVLRHLMEEGVKVEGGDRLGKTIIFAKNHNHAEFIVERFNYHYPHLAGKFCRVVDSTVNYVQSLIDEFYIGDKDPIIAVSVDMLDTGIDVPEIVNLVFFKRTWSKTKFWQMIGRGTRLCPDLFGPGEHKQCFYLFDYCENLEFFTVNPDGVEGKTSDSVKEKIFKRRVALARSLQDREGAGEDHEVLWAALLDLLCEQVSKMDVNNFIVRPHRKHVEKFATRARWNRLTEGDAGDLFEHLAKLPTPDDDNEKARRFDLLMLNLQLEVLSDDPSQNVLIEKVKELAAALEEKRTVPSVSAQLKFLLELQSDEFWEGVTLSMLENIRQRMRDLIRFIDQEGKRDIVYSRFEDEIDPEGIVIFPLVEPDPALGNYRLKVERFVREHDDHVTIRRLRNNQPITHKDLEALEDILFSDDGPGSREDYERTYGDQRLGRLVREIVGLDQNAAKEAFADYLNEPAFSGDQITFINQIIDHVVQTGVIEPDALFEPPFTDQHFEGVVGMFRDEAENVVAILETINRNAEAA